MRSNFLARTDSGALRIKPNTDLSARQRKTFGNRLLKLAAYLSKLPSKNYNHAYLVETIHAKKPACGAVACAFGHAVISGQFKDINVRAKFKFNPEDNICEMYRDEIDFEVKNVKKLAERLNALDREKIYKPEYISEDNMENPADVYFGPGTWDAVFDECAYTIGYPKKSVVVNRIRKLADKCYGVKA
jgi:hypothetical protein